MYIVQLSNIGEFSESRTINVPVETRLEAESAACREAGKIVGDGTGYLCYIGHGNYLIRIGKFVKGVVKIRQAKPKFERGDQVT